ncbi:hypothetical protein [Aeoliella sp.]|uniref:hypothetical protein n=1 Tax=Aeoliella sp. TaxID=2795800 RepID=UPI003CCBF602
MAKQGLANIHARLLAAVALSSLILNAQPAVAVVTVVGDVTPDPLVDDVDVVVGNTAYGLVQVDGGSTLSSTSLRIGDGQPSATGRVEVSGVGSKWTVTGSVDLATPGLGFIDISAGGVLSAAAVHGLYGPAGYAEVNVTGDGSMLEITNQLDLSRGGLLDLNLSDRAIFNAPQAYVRFWSGARVVLDDAFLRAGDLELHGRLSGSGVVTTLQNNIEIRGTIDVGPLDDMRFTSDLGNVGLIEIEHGALEVSSISNAQSGYVTLQSGILRTMQGDNGQPAFINHAHLAAIGGTSDLYSDLLNLSGTLSVVNNSLMRIHGDVTNTSGNISIAPDSKALVLGDFHFNGGTLHADLDGDGKSPFGELEVVGDVHLGGSMRLEAASLSAFSAGDQFALVSATGEISGGVQLHEMPDLGDGLAWKLKRTANTLSLSVGLPGDFNGDNQVNLADYVVWRNSLGSYGNFLAADEAGASGMPDGFVDQQDYELWKANFGRTADASIASASSAVPEPGAFAILACGVLLAVSTGTFTRYSK